MSKDPRTHSIIGAANANSVELTVDEKEIRHNGGFSNGPGNRYGKLQEI